MRSVILGVDGLTFRVLHPLIERGELPNFAKLATQGSEAILESKYPPLTPPAWTSLSTGLKPARHGVYDFWIYEDAPDGGRTVRVQTKRKGGKAIWNILSEYGKQVLVLNVPITYPPEPVNGIMVSGYMTPSSEVEFTYPASFKEELFREVPEYEIDIDLHDVFGKPDSKSLLINRTIRMTERRIELLSYMLKNKPWDFCYVAFVGPDRLQHSLWEQIIELDPKATEYFRVLDRALGVLLEQLGPEDTLFVASDHGFQGVTHVFNINEYLRKKGLLVSNATEQIAKAGRKTVVKNLLLRTGLLDLARITRKKLKRSGVLNIPHKDMFRPLLNDIDLEKTIAYAPSLSGYPGSYTDIFVQEPLESERVQQLIKDLKGEINPMSGKPMAQAVYTTEVLGEGPFAPREAHIIVLPNEGTTFRMNIGDNLIWRKTTKVRGTHQKDGVFYAYGGGIKQGFKAPNAEIYDLVPTVLRSMALPLPHTFDGRTLDEIFIEQKQAEEGSGAAKAEGGKARRKLKKLLEV